MTDDRDREAARPGPRGPGLGNLRAPRGANRRPKRVGRGEGSGHGGTSTYGHKGQESRTSPGRPRGHEGGQMPLQRRIPKRGFRIRSPKRYAVVNVSSLAAFEAGSRVDAEALIGRGIVRKALDGIRLLGDGEITKPLTVELDHVSEGARGKIERAGGRVVLVGGEAVQAGTQDGRNPESKPEQGQG